jgi:hypothetical protein
MMKDDNATEMKGKYHDEVDERKMAKLLIQLVLYSIDKHINDGPNRHRHPMGKVVHRPS